MIGLFFTELAQLFIDLTVREEEERRAAKAAVAAAVGTAIGAFDPASAAACGVKATKELVAMAVKDQEALALVDAGGDTLAGLFGGSWLEMAKGAAGAAAGAGIGAASGGSDGAAFGMGFGSSLLRGDLRSIMLKTGGATAGCVTAATASDERDRGQALKLGLNLGSSVGGNLAKLAELCDADELMALSRPGLNEWLKPEAEALCPKDQAAQHLKDLAELRAEGLRGLIGEGAGVTAGTLLFAARRGSKSDAAEDLGRLRGAAGALTDLSDRLVPWSGRGQVTAEEEAAPAGRKAPSRDEAGECRDAKPPAPKEADFIEELESLLNAYGSPAADVAANVAGAASELRLRDELEHSVKRAQAGDGAAADRVDRLQAELEQSKRLFQLLGQTSGLADGLRIVNHYRLPPLRGQRA